MGRYKQVRELAFKYPHTLFVSGKNGKTVSLPFPLSKKVIHATLQDLCLCKFPSFSR